PGPFVEAHSERACRESLELVRPFVEKFPVVILSASYTYYYANDSAFLQRFLDTAQGLAQRGKLVILMGKVPVISSYDPRCREKALSYPMLSCSSITAPSTSIVGETNARLREFARQTPG